MSAPQDSTEVTQLYQEFSDSLRVNNDEEIRRIYRELLRLGRPRAEIVDEVARLAGSGGGSGGLVIEQRTPPPAEALSESDRMEQTLAPVGSVLHASKNTCGAILETQGSETGIILRTAEQCASHISPEIQRDLAGDIASSKADPELAVLPRSRIRRVAYALAGVGIALISALALLTNISTAEKTASPLTAGNRQETSKAETPKAVTEPADTHVTAQPALPPDKSVQTNNMSASNSLSAAPVVASIGARSGQGPQTPLPAATLPDPNSLGSPNIVSPQTTSTVRAPADIGSKQGARPGGDVAALMTRGDSLFGNGDLVSARLFYERAANGGSGQAALRLAETYDPRFLGKTHLGGLVRGDMAAAVFWYRRAHDLGASEAAILLESIPSK